MADSALDKLLAQQKMIQDKIREERKKEQSKIQALHDKKSQIVGSALLEEIKTNSTLEHQIKAILDKQVKSKMDRELLGLSALKEENKKDKI